MKKLLITLCLLMAYIGVSAQIPDSTKLWFANDKITTADTIPIFSCDSCVLLSKQLFAFNQSDTTEVLAYVLKDYKKAKFKWIKMYAVSSNWGILNIGDLKVYNQYLMPDRKTKSIYKVIFSISK